MPLGPLWGPAMSSCPTCGAGCVEDYKSPETTAWLNAMNAPNGVPHISYCVGNYRRLRFVLDQFSGRLGLDSMRVSTDESTVYISGPLPHNMSVASLQALAANSCVWDDDAQWFEFHVAEETHG